MCPEAREEEMAVNKTEWDQIEILMRDALSEHDQGKMQRFKSWSPLGGTVAIVLFVAIQWNAYTVFRTHTEDKLANIEARLLELRAPRYPAKVLKEIGDLDQKIFAKALPAPREVVDRPIDEVNPDPAVLQQVATQLHNTPPTEPEYWPIALQFIQFASARLAVDAPPSSTTPGHLSNVVSNPPGGIAPFSHQAIILDRSIAGLRFENCRIIFGSSDVRLRSVIFINCVFEFPNFNHPTPYLMAVGSQILTSGIQSAIVTV